MRESSAALEIDSHRDAYVAEATTTVLRSRSYDSNRKFHRAKAGVPLTLSRPPILAHLIPHRPIQDAALGDRSELARTTRAKFLLRREIHRDARRAVHALR